MSKTNRLPALLILAVSVVFSLFAAELIVRSFFDAGLGAHFDERNLLYRYDEDLGWFPVESSERTFTGSREIRVKHNREGFRDHEHGQKTKARIAFLGDSYVWGYDVEVEDRFTDRLAQMLPDHEILNFGVSGYGTDQEYLLLKKVFAKYDPDVVFLVITQDNDLVDNRVNSNHGGYYKPYFVVNGGALELRGVPVPRSLNYFYSEHPLLAKSYLVRAIARLYFQYSAPPLVRLPDPSIRILKEMRSFVEARGAMFLIGLQGSSAWLHNSLKQNGFKYVSLQTPYRFLEKGRHWTPTGHEQVARKIRTFLKRNQALGSQ